MDLTERLGDLLCTLSWAGGLKMTPCQPSGIQQATGEMLPAQLAVDAAPICLPERKAMSKRMAVGIFDRFGMVPIR